MRNPKRELDDLGEWETTPAREIDVDLRTNGDALRFREAPSENDVADVEMLVNAGDHVVAIEMPVGDAQAMAALLRLEAERAGADD